MVFVSKPTLAIGVKNSRTNRITKTGCIMTSKAIIDRAIAANPSIKPNRIRAALKPRRHEEADQQAMFMEWCRWAAKHTSDYPMLRLIHCSLNGVKLSATQACRAKQQGMLKGVCDLFLPVPKKGFNGLFLEMKSETGRVTPEQSRFMRDVVDMGYDAHVCYSAKEAIAVIQGYYGVENGR